MKGKDERVKVELENGREEGRVEVGKRVKGRGVIVKRRVRKRKGRRKSRSRVKSKRNREESKRRVRKRKRRGVR